MRVNFIDDIQGLLLVREYYCHYDQYNLCVVGSHSDDFKYQSQQLFDQNGAS